MENRKKGLLLMMLALNFIMASPYIEGLHYFLKYFAFFIMGVGAYFYTHQENEDSNDV